jgi:spore maturation protein CgeB
VDRECSIDTLTGLRERYADEERILWIDADDPEAALVALTRWQMGQGPAPAERIVALVHPFHQRLAPDYYGVLRARIEAGSRVGFWERARYAKFRETLPRVLLVSSQYFLMGEVIAACRRLGAPHHFIAVGGEETGRSEFVQQLLQTVLEFKPDFVLTINHLGVDREGVLPELLERLELPLASWFVDNPHLILYHYTRLSSPYTTIFTWDADNLDSLAAQGFERVHYLPLATDVTRFVPVGGAVYAEDVAFVGNSMLYKVAHRMKAARPPRELLVDYRGVAAGFGESEERSVYAYLRRAHPELVEPFEALGDTERKLAYETMITWEATRQYRLACVAGTLGFDPLIVGDPGWDTVLRGRAGQGASWRRLRELNYYEELPGFYPRVKVNFNCTSKQMKGAVNQRIFDVPACGGFVLSDERAQQADLFEPGVEAATYTHPDEVPEMVDWYLSREHERRRIAEAARARILAEHTYDHRLTEIFRVMKRQYG